jgi:hypothetical protein
MRPWYTILFRGRVFRRENRGWLAGLAESILAASLLLSGVVFLVTVLTLTFRDKSLGVDGAGESIDWYYLSLQMLVAVALIGVGTWRIVWLLWKVGVSAERRSAIVKKAVDQAGELELVREFRLQRDDLPTVPLDLYPPHQGIWKKFRLVPSPRNVWGLVAASTFSVVFVVLTTILLLTATHTIDVPKADLFASALAVPIGLAAVYSIWQFFRQFLKLTGIGPTSIEIDRYPLVPGEEFQITLTQMGRVRLQLLDVEIVCLEEATFSEGTDIRTERTTVYSQRLLRRRGVVLNPDAVWRTDLTLKLPADAIHSFRSRSNRIQWKLIVTAKALSWPRLRRNFAFTVHPRSSVVNRPKPAEPNRFPSSTSI